MNIRECKNKVLKQKILLAHELINEENRESFLKRTLAEIQADFDYVFIDSFCFLNLERF